LNCGLSQTLSPQSKGKSFSFFDVKPGEMRGTTLCAWPASRSQTEVASILFTSACALLAKPANLSLQLKRSLGLVSGGTDWLDLRGNVVPGEIITLRFAIWDTFDGLVDSASGPG
jgi:hypothetical protein